MVAQRLKRALRPPKGPTSKSLRKWYSFHRPPVLGVVLSTLEKRKHITIARLATFGAAALVAALLTTTAPVSAATSSQTEMKPSASSQPATMQMAQEEKKKKKGKKKKEG